MIRFALVTNVLSHYRLPCFKNLYHTMTNGIAFYFLAKEMLHRSYILTNEKPPLPAIWLSGWNWHRPPQDDKHLNNIMPVVRGGYDVIIIGGWDEPTYVMLWLWGILFRKKILFWIESTSYDSSRGGFRGYYKRLLLKYAAGCIVPGKRSFEFCSMLGMPKDKIFIAPNATDREYFRRQADQLLPIRQQIRQEMSLSGTVMLFVGRHVEEHKNISVLIHAFGKLNQHIDQINLILVGDGPDRKSYESMVQEKGIEGVQFMGELSHDQLCRIYAASDILVLPSRWEPWGFVLNEGMEFGLPLVISESVGAGPDLVHEGENGFVFPAGDIDALTKKLEILIADNQLRTRMGQASRKIIEKFSPENWAKGVIKAINSVSNKTGSKDSRGRDNKQG